MTRINGWVLYGLTCFLFIGQVHSQTPAAVEKAMAGLKTVPGFEHSHNGLYITEVATGKVLAAYNSNDMFIPASTQKVIALAYSLHQLGDTFRFRTTFELDTTYQRTRITLNQDGDPTFGSTRFNQTNPDTIIKKIWLTLKRYSPTLNIVYPFYLPEPPDALNAGINPKWLWEDVANYYAAPARGFNGHEN